MIKIKPKMISFPEVEIHEIDISTMSTKMYATSSQVYWQVFNVTETEIEVPTIDENNETYNKVEIQRKETAVSSGNIDIPEDVYMNWLDDSTIIDYVLKILKLELL